MRDLAYLLVFDGFADWEPSFAVAEINKTERYSVRTVGFTPEPVTSMGGLRVLPDAALGEMDRDRAALVILPGGDMWEEGTRAELWPLLRELDRAGVPIAAICAATVEVVRGGLHRGRRHTSNGLDYLRSLVVDYDGADDYVPELSARDGGLITASGAAPVEFAREIFHALDIYSESDRQVWFDLFKHGIMPAESPQ